MEDAREIRSASGKEPHRAMALAVAASVRSWAAIDQATGKLAVLVGVAQHPLSASTGVPWASCTRAIEQYPKEFTRKGIAITREMHKHFPVLMNFVDERNTAHIKWLQWMGYEIVSRTTEHAADGSPFLGFIRIKDV